MRGFLLILGLVMATACGGGPRDVEPSVVTPAGETDVAAGSTGRSGSLAASVDRTALAHLLERAREEHSSAVVILKDGEVVVEEYFGGQPSRIYAMSATKSIVALAVLHLLDQGLLDSLDAPVSTWFPELRAGPKAGISVRHLMNHTSGVDPQRGIGRDFVRHFAESRQLFKPGTAFQYNNNAVDFLGVVIERIARVPLQDYMEGHFFGPMGIDATFQTNASGQPLAAGELRIRPVDLARFGQLMLDGGVWQGKRILSREAVRAAIEQSQQFTPTCGLLWWREVPLEIVLSSSTLERWAEQGLSPSVTAALRRTVGVIYTDPKSLREALEETAGDRGLDELVQLVQRDPTVPMYDVTQIGPLHSFSARGWLGQYLVIVPEAGLVGVRMRRKTPNDDSSRSEHAYAEFPGDMLTLVAN